MSTKNYNHRTPKILTVPGSNKKTCKIKSKYKYHKLKNSERLNERLLIQEYLVVVFQTS